MKFNKTETISTKFKNNPSATANNEGGLAFIPDLHTDLMLRVATALVNENSFYKSGARMDVELIQTVQKMCLFDPTFVLKLANYARKELNLRSVSTMLLAEFANSGAPRIGDERKWVTDTIRRPDDITELIAYQLSRNSATGRTRQKIPMLLKAGIREAFHKFDAYQLAKYDRDGAVKLADALRITRPKPVSDKESEMFKNLRNRTLPTPETWETTISREGNTKDAWTKILPKMGYFAILRNIRNMLEAGVDMQVVSAYIADPVRVEKSRLFPFRFYSAYTELSSRSFEPTHNAQVGIITEALEKAMDFSATRFPPLYGSSFIMLDVSGSMTQGISRKSRIRARDIALLFGAMSSRICGSKTICRFATHFDFATISGRSTLSDAAGLGSNTDRLGGATYAHFPIQYIREKQEQYDRILMFSDMDSYGSSSVAEQFAGYQQIFPKTKMYAIHLSSGNPTLMMPTGSKNFSTITGWTDRIFDFIGTNESGIPNQVEAVKSRSLPGLMADRADRKAGNPNRG
jgi:60 kDa SS-A/Ro ribonucleoprotein